MAQQDKNTGNEKDTKILQHDIEEFKKQSKLSLCDKKKWSNNFYPELQKSYTNKSS